LSIIVRVEVERLDRVVDGEVDFEGVDDLEALGGEGESRREFGMGRYLDGERETASERIGEKIR